MKLVWNVEPSDAKRVRDFVRERRRTDLVRWRYDECVRGNHPRPTVARFWRGLVLGLVTTQQRSGPDSSVHRFLAKSPFPLSYRNCASSRAVDRLAARELKKHGGIRRTDTIASQLSKGMKILQSPERDELKMVLGALDGHRGPRREREAARFLADAFPGIGPKQSRNVLQFLGLTRYEIPLDSRIVKWLNEHDFPIHLSATGLADPAYYEFVLDGVQALCKAAGVYPCIFDAAVFTSFDE